MKIKLAITVLAGIGLILACLFYLIPAFRGDIAVVSGFHLGSFPIRYYGFILATAILASFFAALRLAKRAGIPSVQIENAAPWIVIFGLVGARLYFVAFSWDYFSNHLGDIYRIWNGGLSIYGGVIGAALGLFFYTGKNKLSSGRFFDIAAIALPLGQAIGRLGNFFNEEAFGQPTDLPWRMYISPAARPAEYLSVQFFHPTFLYEMLWDLLVFAVLWRVYDTKGKREKHGHLFSLYLIFYSLGRFFIEGLRLDSFFWRGVRVDQITALAMIMVGFFIVIILRRANAFHPK